MLRSAALASILAGSLWSANARAADRDEPPATPMTPDEVTRPVMAPDLARPPQRPVYLDDRRSWYGWQTLIILGAGDALLISSAASSGGGSGTPAAVLFFSGATLHVFAGPAVHWAHGRLGIGALALGINVAAIGTGALIGGGIDAAANNCGDHDFVCLSPFVGIALGAIAGGFVGPAIDMAALSTERRKEDEARLFVMPITIGRAHGVAVGGTF